MTGTYNVIDGGLADGGGFGTNANPGAPNRGTSCAKLAAR